MTRTDNQRRGRRLGLIVVVLLVIAGAFALRFHALGRPETAASIAELQRTAGVPVEVARAEERELATWITLAGTVKGVVQYSVTSNNALRVVDIPVREGDRVGQGDVVLRLAEEAPSPMFHSVVQARASYERALVDVRRLRNLYAEGAISRQELDQAETHLAVAASSLADAEGSTALTAAAAGVVTSIVTELGATVPTNKPLLWIARTDTVKVVFQAGSRQALELAIGQQAVLTLPDGELRTGVLSRLDLMADPSTHLLEGEVRFANHDGRLLPGLLLSFAVRTRHRPSALALPTECLVRTDQGDAIWVIAGGGDAPVATLRRVDVGVATTDAFEVTAGLAAHETAVRFGQSLLYEGALVLIVNSGQEG
jgi:RND family efflux transporter MFP subunit